MPLFFCLILFYQRTSYLNDLYFDELKEKEEKINEITGNRMCIKVHIFPTDERIKRIVGSWRSIGKRSFHGFFVLFIALWVGLFLSISCLLTAFILPFIFLILYCGIHSRVYDC